MVNQNISILRSALLGMAYGEAFSWSSMLQRSKDLPPWLSRIRHEIEVESNFENITSLPKPFSLNQSPEPLKPAGIVIFMIFHFLVGAGRDMTSGPPPRCRMTCGQMKRRFPGIHPAYRFTASAGAGCVVHNFRTGAVNRSSSAL